jgi:hypothetical protein
MKIQIPESLKSDLPQTVSSKILIATPVIMTVIATMLAGLASSEMTRAQYDRALAAQLQSKAGDQWSFFQAKRLRGALQRNTLDLLGATTGVGAFDPAGLSALPDLQPLLASSTGQQALDHLRDGTVPAAAPAVPAPPLRAVLDAIEAGRAETEITTLLSRIDDATLQADVHQARDQAAALDAATGPVSKVIDQIDALLAREPKTVRLDFTAARLRYAAQRYEAEARSNQAVASLYELQVRKSNLSAERHHARSQSFFYGMLAAQAGVIIATFAMAARQRSLLWSLAAAAGLLAVVGAAYVYLFV